MLHIDSWEMGAQNWTAAFREEFRRRRGYDPVRYLPAITGRVVDSMEVTERFLWDLRQTAQELVIENHAEHLKALGRKNGFGLSIEPYDMMPCADMSVGAVADVPMCEFWLYGFDTTYSVIEASFDRAYVRAAHRGGGVLHFRGRRAVAGVSGLDEGAGGLGVQRGREPDCVPSLAAPAVAGPEAGNDDGAVWGALGTHADVVGYGGRISRIPGAVPVHAAAGVAGGGCLLPGAGRLAASVPAAGVGHARQPARAAGL